MNIIKPKKLKKGDTIGFLAISGEIKEYKNLENAKLFFEQEGYNIVISESCKKFHRYMAGKDDEQCIDELHSFFENKDIDAILCARGGYGTLRLLDKINWNIIKNNPKIFAGYSDITTLLNTIFYKTGLITFHSAMPNGDFSKDIEEYTKESFLNTLSGKQDKYTANNFTSFYSGIAKGRLFGGNLSTLVSLCGTDFIPDENLVLILEDLNEPPYKIDKMLTQLFRTEKIKKNVKGIALGDFLNIENISILDEIILDFAKKLEIPICNGFKITHDKIKDTIPIGVQTIFNSESGEIKLLENYSR